MLVRFKKVDSGGAAMTCTREDGSSTWQKPKPSQAAFFVLHDLTHFAVESVLKRQPGFYSLIAGGWEFSDFDAPKAASRMPPSAQLIELVVGFLDLERASQTRWSAEEFNQHIAQYEQTHQYQFDFEISNEELADIRSRRSELFSRWDGVPLGDCLELDFA